jgi:hypothetical protein
MLCQFIIINIINNNRLNISHNLAIPNYIIPIKKGGKKEKQTFLYDPAMFVIYCIISLKGEGAFGR